MQEVSYELKDVHLLRVVRLLYLITTGSLTFKFIIISKVIPHHSFTPPPATPASSTPSPPPSSPPLSRSLAAMPSLTFGPWVWHLSYDLGPHHDGLSPREHPLLR